MFPFGVYLSPSGHVFNIAWQAMIKTYNTNWFVLQAQIIKTVHLVEVTDIYDVFAMDT